MSAISVPCPRTQPRPQVLGVPSGCGSWRTLGSSRWLQTLGLGAEAGLADRPPHPQGSQPEISHRRGRSQMRKWKIVEGPGAPSLCSDLRGGSGEGPSDQNQTRPWPSPLTCLGLSPPTEQCRRPPPPVVLTVKVTPSRTSVPWGGLAPPRRLQSPRGFPARLRGPRGEGVSPGEHPLPSGIPSLPTSRLGPPWALSAPCLRTG